MKQRTWKKAAAFALALTLVAGAVPANTWTGGLFGGTAIVANAAEYSEGDDASIFSISVGDTFDAGSTITRNNSAGVLQEIYVDDYCVFKYYGPGTYTVNENLTLTAVDGVKYYFDSTDTNDLTNATVTVDVAAKSTTVKIGDKNVGPAKYDVKYGSTLENATADFPTQAGSYYAFVTAKETAGNYIGQAKSEAFTVSAEEAVTWTDISANKSQDGISITSSGVDFMGNYIYGYNGSITFTSTAGKIKMIEISCNGQYNMKVFGNISSGWKECWGDGPLVWNGTAADSVTLSARNIDISEFAQIVYTLEAKSDISDTTVTVDTDNQSVSVTRGNAFIPEDEYEVTYGTTAETATADFPTASGKYYAFVTAKADSTYYTGTAKSEAFTVVNTITLNSENVTIADFTYDGTEKTPVLKYGETVLTKGTDYEIVETEGDTTSAKDAGTYTIHVNGKGDYKGDNVELTWKITQADLTLSPAVDLVYKPNTAQNLIAGDVPAGTKFTLTPPQEPDYETERTKVGQMSDALIEKAYSEGVSSEEHDYYCNAGDALGRYFNAITALSAGNKSEAADFMQDAQSEVNSMERNSITPSDEFKEAIDYINTYIKGKTLDDLKARFATVEPDDWSDTITGTDAGDYTVYYKGDGVNYDDSTVKSLTATIAKATPDAPTGLTGTAGKPLSSVTLPEGWTWSNGEKLLDDPGTWAFDATYTPGENSNYNAYDGSVTVAVTVDMTELQAAIDDAREYYDKINKDYAEPAAELKTKIDAVADDVSIGRASYTLVTSMTEALNNAVEKAKEQVVNAVIEKIHAIGEEVTYTDDCKKLIDTASTAYDALDEEQQKAVTNARALTYAESLYAALEANKTAAEQAKADKEAALAEAAEQAKADKEAALAEAAEKAEAAKEEALAEAAEKADAAKEEALAEAAEKADAAKAAALAEAAEKAEADKAEALAEAAEKAEAAKEEALAEAAEKADADKAEALAEAAEKAEAAKEEALAEAAEKADAAKAAALAEAAEKADADKEAALAEAAEKADAAKAAALAEAAEKADAAKEEALAEAAEKADAAKAAALAEAAEKADAAKAAALAEAAEKAKADKAAALAEAAEKADAAKEEALAEAAEQADAAKAAALAEAAEKADAAKEEALAEAAEKADAAKAAALAEAAEQADADKTAALAEAAEKADAAKAAALAEAAEQADADKAAALAEAAEQADADKAAALAEAAEQADAAKEEALAEAEQKAAEEKAAADAAAVAKVTDLINAIGKIVKTNDCENKIVAARSAYNTLTEEQKTIVKNYAALVKAESDYAALPDELPQTGMSGMHKVAGAFAALMTLAGFGLARKNRRRDDEE